MKWAHQGNPAILERGSQDFLVTSVLKVTPDQAAPPDFLVSRAHLDLPVPRGFLLLTWDRSYP